MQVKKQKLERDIEEWTGSKLRMEYVKAVYCHLVYFMCRVHHSNTGLGESQTGIKIAWRNINNFRYADDTTLMAESKEELKSLLMRIKETLMPGKTEAEREGDNRG